VREGVHANTAQVMRLWVKRQRPRERSSAARAYRMDRARVRMRFRVWRGHHQTTRGTVM